MVCRTRPGGSASTSLANQLTDLSTNEVLSLSHQLRHEGADLPAPTAGEVAAWVGETRAAVQAAPNLSDARRASILSRLDQVASGPAPSGAEFHSWRHIVARSRAASDAINGHLAQVASVTGRPPAEVHDQFNSLYRQADQRSSGLVADRAWAERFQADASNGLVPADRGTLYALHELHQTRRPALQASSGDSGPSRRSVPGRLVTEVGYDRATGRLDLCFRPDSAHSGPGTVIRYENVGSSVSDDLTGAANPDLVYERVVAGRYPIAGTYAAGAAADQQRCPDCGEFTGAGPHDCARPGAVNSPPPGVIPITGPADARIPAGRSNRPAGGGVPIGFAGGTVPEPERSTPALADVAPTAAADGDRNRNLGPDRLVMAETRVTEADNFAVAVPRRADVRAFAAEHPEFYMPVQARSDDQALFVEGNVRVHNSGRYLHVGSGDLRCSCGTDDCDHRRAVADAVEAVTNGRRGHGSITQIRMAIAERDRQLHAERRTSETRITGIRHRAHEAASMGSYAENFAAFRAAWDRAAARREAGETPVPFQPRAGITGGLADPSEERGFGVEIEFMAPRVAQDQIVHELHRRGFTNTSHMQGYHGTSRHRAAGGWDRWGIEEDATVSGEIVSPILYDRDSDWEELAEVCRIVRDNGGYADEHTGSHIHVGLGDWDHQVDRHNVVLDDFRRNEDLLYRLAARPGAQRHRLNMYCAPQPISPGGYRSLQELRVAHGSHFGGINFGAVYGQPADHVEFRLWDGSIDPGVIQTQATLSLGMVAAAAAGRARPAADSSGPLGSHRVGVSRRRLRGAEWEEDTRPVRSFLDRVCFTEAARQQAVALYAVNRWQRRR